MMIHSNPCLRIGLLNNMPDAAVAATERQFRNLLREAGEGQPVRLLLFSLPAIARSREISVRVEQLYAPFESLWAAQLDGLIVTGAEPVARDLRDEPFWETMAQVVDWTERHVTSSLWSCLAAHVAVLHLDGIARRPLREKLFGVFEGTVAAKHKLLPGAPYRYWSPQSRRNDVAPEDLTASGYHLLGQLDNGSADLFAKPGRNLTVFLQGHPEYEAETLELEYRRDMRRYLSGRLDRCPALPQAYLQTGVSLAESAVASEWRKHAVCLYRNWLSYLWERRRDARKSAQTTVWESKPVKTWAASAAATPAYKPQALGSDDAELFRSV